MSEIPNKTLELQNMLADTTLKTLITLDNTHIEQIENVKDLFEKVDHELTQNNVPLNLGNLVQNMSAISRSDPKSLKHLHFWAKLLAQVLCLKVYKISTVSMIWKQWCFAFLQCVESHEREDIKVRDIAIMNLTNTLRMGSLPIENQSKNTEGVKSKWKIQ